MNIVEHLAAEEPDIFVTGGDQNRDKKTITIGITFARWPETQLQMIFNVSL